MDKPQPQQKSKFSLYFYNRTTYFGASLALIVFFIECLLFGIDFFSDHHNIYLGIVTYTVLPPFLILGLLLIPIGALRRRSKVLKGVKTARQAPMYINFSNPRHRNAFIVFTVGTMILIVMTAVGSYQAFHYTESVHFCGITCHKVMHPQYTRYTQSAHARVKCVECHIGAGADWYVRSKLSGVRQVFATIGNTFPRPIPTPVHNLRPAEETCEQCHWPEKFYSSFELRRKYFLMEGNEHPSWFLRMLIQMGGAGDKNAGIHAHMNIDNDIFYYAEDEKRQEISWVKTVNKQGVETVYTSSDSGYKEKEPPAELIRKMDCIDCHNRPTHRFVAPYRLVNLAMETGAVDPALPGIKEKAVEVLSAEHETTEEANTSIRQSLVKYYQKRFGNTYGQHKQKVDDAIEQIIHIYKNNYFPEMKARWDSYPDNIGHLISPGCFRCHAGEHTSSDGKTISRDCTVCHTIIEQGPPGELEKSTEGLPFRHPIDISEMWIEMNCTDCHAASL